MHHEDPRLSLATVLYGGREVLVRTLPTWRAATEAVGVPTLIVDNSEADDAAGVVAEALPDAHVIRRPTNPGFAASANEAVASSTTDWVLLLNADVFLTVEALTRCLEWIGDASRDPIHECAAISLVTQGEEHCGVELNAVGYFSDRPAGASRPPLGPSGGAALVSRSLFEAVGGFDADLFAWGEDGGFSLRLAAQGVRTHALRLALPHVGGHSVASIEGQRFKARLLARNRIRVMRRDWTVPLKVTLGPAQLVLILLNGLRKLKFGTAGPHFAGAMAALGESVRQRGDYRFGIGDFASYWTARM